jgi:AcrR family transcriptional regulator
VVVLYGTRAPRRRDAQRNRDAIVAAASDLLSGPARLGGVGMPEIARRAGVGQATLYRHFSDRHALTVAVVECQLERLEACAAAAAESPCLFRLLVDAVLRANLLLRPLVVLARRLEPAQRDRYRRRVLALLAGPLRRAQESGLVPADLTPEDLLLLFAMVEGVVTGLGEAAASRAIDLALAGVFRPKTSTF